MTISKKAAEAQTIFERIKNGGVCRRKGHKGEAAISRSSGEFVVWVYENGRPKYRRKFDYYWPAIGYMNTVVGKVEREESFKMGLM
jgi:hypothetical protein